MPFFVFSPKGRNRQNSRKPEAKFLRSTVQTQEAGNEVFSFRRGLSGLSDRLFCFWSPFVTPSVETWTCIPNYAWAGSHPPRGAPDCAARRRGRHLRTSSGALEHAGRWVGNRATFASLLPHFFGVCPQLLGNSPKSGVKSGQKLPSCPLTGQPFSGAKSSCVLRSHKLVAPLFTCPDLDLSPAR